MSLLKRLWDAVLQPVEPARTPPQSPPTQPQRPAPGSASGVQRLTGPNPGPTFQRIVEQTCAGNGWNLQEVNQTVASIVFEGPDDSREYAILSRKEAKVEIAIPTSYSVDDVKILPVQFTAGLLRRNADPNRKIGHWALASLFDGQHPVVCLHSIKNEHFTTDYLAEVILALRQEYPWFRTYIERISSEMKS